MTTITVNGPRPYDVLIGQDLDAKIAALVADHPATRVAIVHQPPLADAARELSAALAQDAGVKVTCLEIPDAEDGKTLATAGRLWDALGAAAFGRQDLIIGLGGGAATDLAGFVAAAWMRGIDVIQVPTTLLAMVDAAVGGKTGINTEAGKNLVGAFHEPIGVFIDLARLHTLPASDLVAGSAEIIKTGFIADEQILAHYEEDPAGCLTVGDRLADLVARSVSVKARVVGQDLKESGLREILNYGHTFGHAVERYENYRWRHGSAVAVGMMFAAELARGRGLISADLVERHRRILRSVGLPTGYEPGRFDDLYTVMTRDKKNRAGTIRFVALDGEVGVMTRIEGPSLDELRGAYASITSPNEAQA
ncbi:3-dehydroquinate synthase [Corynebacterium uterequi]|uniref:3-dehydroquinate synthase n=1 Tax=Corynebacterium uterequi TaxID=1072256 RepID=A0A0G3HCW8_9CORY|nr:3-dehydroquinate synthase [Corynebacterium uterequi]AKK11206.1 3-dehydroquinate synthase [Corynebacterium uterequi]